MHTIPQKPLVSVIIPAYNAAAHVERAISSALKQNYTRSEIIVVDDGSIDNTAALVSAFGNRVEYVWQPNSGTSAARNKGTRLARGDYVAFLDADDEWYSGHLERAVAFFLRHPTIVWFGAENDDMGDEASPLRLGYVQRLSRLLQGKEYFDDYFKAAKAGVRFCTDTLVIRRDVLLELGGFDEMLRYGQDHDLRFRIALKYPKVGYSTEKAAIYWHRSDTLSHSGDKTTETLLRRIKKDETLIETAGKELCVRCRPVIMQWVERALKDSIRSQNRTLLRVILSEYQSTIQWHWRLASRLSICIPTRWSSAVLAWGGRVLDQLRKLVRKYSSNRRCFSDKPS